MHLVIENIKKDWNNLKERNAVSKDNKLHYFYQEYLEGKNGVASFMNREFNYDCSNKREDIVSGKKGEVSLNEEQEKELLNFCKKLYHITEKEIQVEFVIHKKKVFIVEFKLFGDHNEDHQNRYISYKQVDCIRDCEIKEDNCDDSCYEIVTPEEKIVAKGNSFSKMVSNKILCPEDVLVIQGECEDEFALENKKGLIVKNNDNFSHILGLSHSKRIPSIYGVGNKLTLPQKFILDTLGSIAYIIDMTENKEQEEFINYKKNLH